MVNIPDGTQTVYISFSAEINANTTQTLIATMADCANKGVQEVNLLFSTPGGNVREGLNLYNTLRAMPFQLVVHNVGNVDSIGNAVFLAGERRYTAPHSTFMFHGVGFNASQGQRLEEQLLRDRLDNVLADQKRIGAIIAERTALNEEQIADLFRHAQTKDAAYALEQGIAHEIRDVQIQRGIPIVPLVFQN